jgi:signal transduction histidine kinase
LRSVCLDLWLDMAASVLAAVAVPVLVVGSVVASESRVPPFRALDVLAYALLVLAGGALAARSRYPAGVFAVTLACCAAMVTRNYAYGPVFVALYVALTSVVVRQGLRRGLAAAGIAGTTLLVVDIAGWIVWYASSLLVFAVGAVIRLDRERREERRLRRAQDERLDIAREVHDVLGHSLSVISMRAGVALHVADRRPDQALAALEAIRQISKDALNELRATLDIIRDREAHPGPEQVGDLVESIRETGQPVELVVNGDPGGLNQTTGRAVYRVVQEALTNVVRHTHHATATVTIGYGPDEVVVSVIDDGTGPARTTPGDGITGMRERVTALRGTLTAAPRAEGGFAVHARLPVAGGDGA